MKRNIRMMKSIDELSENNKGIRNYIRNIWNFKKKHIFLTCIKCLKSLLRNLLKTIFTT